MATKLNQSFMLNLANQGDFRDFSTLGLDTTTFTGTDAKDWGSAVVEIMKVNGGHAESFSSAKELKVAGSLFVQDDIPTETSESLRAVVTTADSTKMYGRLKVVGEGKD